MGHSSKRAWDLVLSVSLELGAWLLDLLSPPSLCSHLLMRLPLLLAIFLSCTAFAEDLPTVPIGLDAYRRWDLWPQQRIGVRAYMRSTYDRRGGNEGADASHFLCQFGEDQNVTL